MNIAGTLKGRYKFITVSPDGRESYPLGDKWHDNLILNSGLDMLFNGAPPANAPTDLGFLGVMAYCRLSEGETGSVSPTDTLLANQNTSTGSYVKTNPSGTDTVNQVTYTTDSTYIKATFQRTFVFPPQNAAKNWNGIGVSNSAAALDPLFSKLITVGTVTVAGDAELRVVYQLTVNVPKDHISVTISSGGFTGNGHLMAVGTYANLLGGINANGTQSGGTSGSVAAFLRGREAPTGYLLSNTPLPSTNTNIVPSFCGASLADSIHTSSTAGSYTTGQKHRDSTVTWAAGRPTSSVTNVRMLLFGPAGAATHGLAWHLQNNQSKGATNSLSATVRVAWDRV